MNHSLILGRYTPLVVRSVRRVNGQLALLILTFTGVSAGLISTLVTANIEQPIAFFGPGLGFPVGTRSAVTIAIFVPMLTLAALWVAWRARRPASSPRAWALALAESLVWGTAATFLAGVVLAFVFGPFQSGMRVDWWGFGRDLVLLGWTTLPLIPLISPLVFGVWHALARRFGPLG